MIKKILLAMAAWLVLSPAHAVLTFRLIESGGNVTLTATGRVNTAALVPSFPGVCGSGTGVVNPSSGQFCTGAGSAVRHAGLTGPASFGPGGVLQGTGTSTGDDVYMVGALGELYLPVGYVSGTVLSGTSQFPGTSLAAMGVAPGTYTWTFGSGATADSVVFVVGGPAVSTTVPTLSEAALVALAALLALGTLPALRRRG